MSYSWKTRVFSMLLAVVMVMGMVPMSVFATEGEEGNISPAEGNGEILVINEDTPATAAYKVEHHLQTAEGYELKDTDNMEGTVGELTAASAKTYEGFAHKEFAQIAIAADGSTVVVICYDVKAVQEEPATAAYKVEHHLQTAEGYELKETDNLEGTIGADTAAVAKIYEGFAHKEFAQAAIAADGSTVVAIYYDMKAAEPTTAAYKVEHYLQTAEGYELKDTDNLEGTIGADTAATAKTYEGFTAKKFAQTAIAADGSTVVVIEYDADPVEAEEKALTLSDVVTVISNKPSTLAPGITQNLISANDKNGDRVEMYVAVADLNVETVGVYANYKDNQNKVLGMSKTTEQVAAAEAKHEEPYNVVVAINASYYNMTTGKPTGAFVMEGNDITNEAEGNNYAFFAILKDGTPMIGARQEYSTYKDQIAEAVGGQIHIVKDGKIYNDETRPNNQGVQVKTWSMTDTTKYPRQTVGITADNKVIVMSADGSQAPRSIGLTMKEQAEVMLALGCVEAVHLDGGGSMTYCAKPEGADTIRILNKPCDGSERSVSNSMMFVSTAVPDGEFHHAVLTAEHDYVTPNSEVKISAIGADASGNTAEIPAEGITWQVADTTLGTVENGVFTSSGKAGDAKIQMMYNGAEVGSATIHVVVPDRLVFNQSTVTAPYGKTIELAVTATVNKGVNEVYLKESDISFTLSDDAIGTINGFKLTTCEENAAVTGGTITAVINGTEVSAEATITLGKGSEVLYDFEDGEVGNWKLKPWETTPKVATNLEIVNSQTGKVRSGDNAMALKMDFTQEIGTGYKMAALYFPEDVHIENAQRIGMWVYLPDEFTGLYARYCAYSGAYDPTSAKTNRYAGGTFDPTHGKTADTGCVYAIEESGWYYFSLDVSAYKDIYLWKDARCIEFYSSDRDGTAFGYTYVTTDNKQINTSAYGKYTLYIDDVMVDYSSAADDREAPIFGQVSVINEGEGTTVLNRLTQACAPHVIPTFSTNTLTMNATVAEDTTWTNATGLNESSAKCYVDGYEVGCKFTNGNIILENHYFTNGIHTVRFVMSDNAGNERSAVRKVNITGNAANSTLSLVPADPDADKIYTGSLYYVNLETSALADVGSVSVNLDLNSVSKWELEGMQVARGFTATYNYVGSEDGVVINFTRNGDKLEDTKVLATIPVRAWYHAAGVDPAASWKAQEICPVDIRVEIDSGKMVMKNGDVITFTSDRIRVDTEIYGTYAVLNANGDYANKSSWHIHNAAAIADKAPTCTEEGYTGRTFCETCNSVVVWGTKQAAIGHNYGMVDGILKCKNAECDVLFSGIHTDGKTYVDGVLVGDGWNGDSYYQDGKPLTGVHKLPDPDGTSEFYYDFGEDGISAGKYSGLIEENGKLYYAVVGVLNTGWTFVPGEGEAEDTYYYFDPSTKAAVNGTLKIDGYTYEFRDHKLYNGQWIVNPNGRLTYKWAGSLLCNQWFTLRGQTYHFDSSCYAATGTTLVKLSTGGDSQFFVFDDNGVLQYPVESTGLFTVGENTYYLVDGIVKTGLWEENGQYYYFTSSYKMYTGTYRYVDEKAANGLVTPGYCAFDTDHSLLHEEFADPNNTGTQVYYVMGRADSSKRWVEQDGKKYYLDSNGVPVKGASWVDGVYYYFDEADGHLCDNEFVIVNNTMYYCIGGLIQKLGLVEIDGKTYYISTSSGRVMRDCGYWVAADKNPTGKDQLYYFDETGARYDEQFKELGGVLYYLIDGQPAKLGLSEIDGKLYYISTNSGEVKKGKYYITAANANGRPGDRYYYFGEDGSALNLTFYTENGSLYYMENGLPAKSGLRLIDGYYYYLSTNSGAAKTGRYYVLAKNANGLLPEGYYTFGSDGKMIVE